MGAYSRGALIKLIRLSGGAYSRGALKRCWALIRIITVLPNIFPGKPRLKFPHAYGNFNLGLP